MASSGFRIVVSANQCAIMSALYNGHLPGYLSLQPCSGQNATPRGLSTCLTYPEKFRGPASSHLPRPLLPFPLFKGTVLNAKEEKADVEG